MDEKKKEVYITARCTEKEKDMIHRKAQSQKKTDSKYILDSCLAGAERKTEQIKRVLIKEIEMQECLNHMKYVFCDNTDYMKKEVREKLKKEIDEMERIVNAQISRPRNMA